MVLLTHYENMPIKYTDFSFFFFFFFKKKKAVKIENFQWKIFDIFLFAQNIDCGYTLELPGRGGSKEYP